MSLENMMLRIGRVIAADHNLTVIVQGLRAYASPGRIVLPSISSYDWLGPNAERMLHGLLDHEVGHALYTDFDVVERASKEGNSLFSIFNAIEDGRIEHKMARRYVGCGTNLRQKNRWFWDSPKHQGSFVSADQWSAFTLAVTYVLRSTATAAQVVARRPDLKKMLAESKDALDRAAKADSTEACLTIAKELFDRYTPPPIPLTPETEEEDEKEESEESAPSDDSSEEDEEPQGDQPSEGGDSSDGSSSENSGSCGDTSPMDAQPVEEGEEASGFTISPSWENPGNLTPEDVFNSEIQAQAEEQPYVLFTEDPNLSMIEVDFTGKDEKGASKDLISRANDASYALLQVFENVLRSRREHHYVSGFDEGDIDTDLLSEFALGVTSPEVIYRQPVAADDREVAVSILVDCSGSMSRAGTFLRGTVHKKEESKEELARITACALSLALQSCQVPHEILGFTTATDASFSTFAIKDKGIYQRKYAALFAALMESEKHGVKASSFAREVAYGGELEVGGPLMFPLHGIAKSFDSNDLSGVVNLIASQENLDGESVLWAARRLATRREKRRLLFVLSDGLPAGHRFSVRGDDYLRDNVKKIIEAGIEVYGIGIQSDAVASFYPRYWKVDSVLDLISVALTAMTEVIAEGRQEASCVSI